MSDDIVKRLRIASIEAQDTALVLAEARAEIERLRKELELCQARARKGTYGD